MLENELNEKASKLTDDMMFSFAGIPPEVHADLATYFEEREKELGRPVRRSPPLDLMLFRDPAVVYPVYEAFCRHKLLMLPKHSAEELNEFEQKLKARVSKRAPFQDVQTYANQLANTYRAQKVFTEDEIQKKVKKVTDKILQQNRFSEEQIDEYVEHQTALFRSEPLHSVQDANRIAKEWTLDAIKESAKYYRKFTGPDLANLQGETTPVPDWAQERLIRHGFSQDLPNQSFVNELLRYMKDPKRINPKYELKDRLNVLFKLAPNPSLQIGSFGHTTAQGLFKDHLIAAYTIPTGVTPYGRISHTHVFGDIKGKETMDRSTDDLHDLLMHNPTIVQLAHMQTYRDYVKNSKEYKAAQQKKMQDWLAKKDEETERIIEETDQAILNYSEFFNQEYRLNVKDSTEGRSESRHAKPFVPYYQREEKKAA